MVLFVTDYLVSINYSHRLIQEGGGHSFLGVMVEVAFRAELTQLSTETR